MTRRARQPGEQQCALPLSCDPHGEDALRSVYASLADSLRKCGIRTYEAAMARPAVRAAIVSTSRARILGRVPR